MILLLEGLSFSEMLLQGVLSVGFNLMSITTGDVTVIDLIITSNQYGEIW